MNGHETGKTGKNMEMNGRVGKGKEGKERELWKRKERV